MKRQTLLFGLLITGAAAGSSALTVGRIHGAAWIGQPLSLSVPVQLDSTTADTNLCAEADVYYGDGLKDPSRIRMQQTPGTQSATHIVQIDSAISIDEPMVTVYLRVGCGQKVSRRYVMLADYPSLPATGDARSAVAEAVAASTAVDTPTPPQATPLEPVPAASTATNVAAARSDGPQPASNTVSAPRKASRTTGTATKAEPTQRATPPKPVARPSTSPAAATPAAPAPAQRARLKLDPLENLSERIKTLETTTTAIPLEDMVRDAQRIQQLQGDVKKLLDQAAKNEATLTLMRERIEKAEAERVSSTLVYALAALVLACLAAVAVLWSRRSENAIVRHAWSSSQSEDEDDAPAPAPTTPRAAMVAQAAPAVVPTPQDAAPGVGPALGVDLVEMEVDADSYTTLISSPPAPQAAADSAPLPLLSPETSANDFNSDKQFDLRQQAEFFDSLGKTDQAIELLEKRIRANGKDCPLVYLELLRIANTRSLKTDFRQFRDECMQTFNVAVPEFALFRSEGRALEAYPELLSHIEKMWNTPKVLEVLESCILRDPWEKNAQPFDLAAFKELVMLHGLASRAAPMPALSKATLAAQGKEADAVSQSLGIDLEL